MKRNENLRTLSWEHHDGLVVSFRLKQGLNKKVDSQDMSDYIFYSWNNVLSHHFWQEEQVIKPELLKENSEIKKMYNDHKKFRILIKKIESEKSNLQSIEQFADLLNHHIRFEERSLFPLLEQSLDEKKLKNIGKFLKENHFSVCEVWQNQFWR